MSWRSAWRPVGLAVVGCGVLALVATVVRAGDTVKEGPYPLGTCVVTGEKLGTMGDPVVFQHEGRTYKLCCKMCEKSIRADSKKYADKLDKAVVDMQLPTYPLEVCPVRKGKLGGMGKSVDYVYRNHLVRFCCSGCIGAFKKDAAAILADIDRAVIEKQKETYPLDTCVVSGEEFGSMGKPVDYVFGTRLVRLCCADCIAKLEKDPMKYLAKLGKTEEAPGHGEHGEKPGHGEHGEEPDQGGAGGGCCEH